VPPDCPVRQRATAIQRATVDSDSGNSAAQCAAEVRAAKSEGTGLSGVAPDYPVPQEYLLRHSFKQSIQFDIPLFL
jgi:hypothetical protein